jgi:hypothetical protein
MTYYYNIKRSSSSKNSRLWTDRIFLSVLLLFTSVIAIYNAPSQYLITGVSGAAVLIAVVMLVTRRPKVPFVEIADGTLRYFDTEKGEMISVHVDEITHISTRFCELNIHTPEHTHKLNLDLIRSEKTRWEIKEMIRDIARRAPQYNVRGLN